MQKVRTAVIGVGYLGRFHAQKYAALPDAELVAVVDASAGNREQVAAETGCRAVADYRDILGEVDAVSIATPTPLHYPIAKQCLERGIHVLVEKPITTTLEEARSLVDTAARVGRVLQVGPPRALQRRDPRARRHARHAAVRRVAPPRAVQGAGHGRQCRARPDDPRHRPDPEPRRRADRVDRCRGRVGVLGRSRYRQCPHPLCQRLRGEHHGEPRQHEDGAQAARVPGRRVHLDRPAAESAHDRAQAARGRGRAEGPGADRGAHVRPGRRAEVRDRGVSQSIREGTPPVVTGEDGLRALETATKITQMVQDDARQ